jgi:hypothetical protein
VGNKLIARDFWRWAKGDMWPWLQMLASILFIIVIVVGEAFFIVNLWAMLLLLGVFIAFHLFASWKTYKLERR